MLPAPVAFLRKNLAAAVAAAAVAAAAVVLSMPKNIKIVCVVTARRWLGNCWISP